MIMSRGKKQVVCLVLGAVIGFLFFGLGRLPVFKSLERATLDLRFRIRPKELPQETPVAILLIDDQTLEYLSKPLLDDEDYQVLIEKLISLGARMIVFDTPFVERLGPQMIEPFRVKRGGTSILYPVRFIFKPDELGAFRASHTVASYTNLYKNELCLGHTNLSLDPDGGLRRVKAFIDFEEVSYPFLPLLAVSHYLGNDLEKKDLAPFLDEEGNLMVNYYSKASKFEERSALQIIRPGGGDEKDYKGKIVLVGRQVSSIPDTISTPIQDDYPITELYGTLIANLLHKDLLRFPPAPCLIIVTLFLGTLVGTTVASFRPLTTFILSLTILCSYLAIVFFGFKLNLVMEVLSPGLTIVFGYLATTIFNYHVEERLLSASLAKARLYHKRIVESMYSGLAVIDTEGRIVTLNERAQEVLGVGENVEGVPYQEILEPGRLKEVLEKAFFGWERTKEEEVAYQGKSLVVTGTPLRDEEGKAMGAMIIFQDISEIRKLQEDIKLKERLAAIGELAAGVAHEFRNPLGSIVSATRLLSSQQSNKNEYLGLILKETEIMNGLIDELLYFARPAKLNLSHVDINRFLEDAISLLLSEMGGNIVLQKELKEIPLLKVDPSQMKRAFANLIQNSLEAMGREGELRVKSEKIEIEGEGFVKISIEDTGLGIKEEDIPKIFNPFFTTRPEGTGLGLSIVHKIIEKHHGRIECQSQVGEGTTFSIYLPIG